MAQSAGIKIHHAFVITMMKMKKKNIMIKNASSVITVKDTKQRMDVHLIMRSHLKTQRVKIASLMKDVVSLIAITIIVQQIMEDLLLHKHIQAQSVPRST